MNRKKANQVLRSIKALAKSDARYSINEIRIIVALERAIARLAHNKELADHLIFKKVALSCSKATIASVSRAMLMHLQWVSRKKN